MRNACRASLVVTMLSLLPSLPAALADAPRLDISDATLPGGGPNPQQIAMIKTYLAYWVNELVQASDEKAILNTRTMIENGYKQLENMDYRLAYAKQMAEQVLPLFQKGPGSNPLGSTKELNLALAVGQMPQPSIEPALETMVVHKNPALRYEGWVTYRAILPQILQMGRSPQMLALLSQQTAKETSAPVLGAIFQALSLDATVGTNVPADVLAPVRKQALQILSTHWTTWCKRVVQGDLEMTRAALHAVSALQSVAGDAKPGPVLQALLRMAYASQKAADANKSNKDLTAAGKMLLLECEAALVALSKNSETPIQNALKSQTPKGNVDIWAEAGSAVFKWAESLKSQGVKDPQEDFDAATAPAAPPASPPAAKPARK